jgi:hypothetical protein
MIATWFDEGLAPSLRACCVIELTGDIWEFGDIIYDKSVYCRNDAVQLGRKLASDY